MANQTTANALKGHDAEFQDLTVAGDITVGGDFSYATDGDAEVGGDLTVEGSTTLDTFGCNGATAAAPSVMVDLTDSTGYSGTHNDVLAATTVPAALTGGESPTEAEHNAVLTYLAVTAQNASDMAQKIKEIHAVLIKFGFITAS